MRKVALFILAALLPVASVLAYGGAPVSGGYVAYANIPVTNWDNAAVAKCQSLQPTATDCLNTLVRQITSGLSCQSPLTIGSGGTYSGGCYLSTDSATAAVLINTTSPVVIQNMTIIGPGPLISSNGLGVNYTINNVSTWNNSPTTTHGINLPCGGTCIIENSRFARGGIFIPGSSSASTVVIQNNIIYNIQSSNAGAAHAIQLATGLFPGASITGNVIIDAPYQSHDEDAISLFDARGTSGSPIDVSFNQIIGGYPLDPALNTYSGGGIIADGGVGDTSVTATQFTNVHDNQVFDTTNYGVAIAAGHDNSAYRNLVVSSGVIGGSTPVHAQNVGMYASNIYGQTSDVFKNNTEHDNSLYWFNANSLTSNNTSFGNGGADCTNCTGNTALSNANTIAGALTVESQYLHPYLSNY